MSRQIGASTSQPGMLQDASKATGLLFGILLIFGAYALVVAIKMIWLGRPAGLLELVIFGLLAVDGMILLSVVGRPLGDRPGLLPQLGLWILGLIPYFGWALIYAIGKGIASFFENRQTNVRVLALLVWVCALFLCSAVYWFTAHAAFVPASAASG